MLRAAVAFAVSAAEVGPGRHPGWNYRSVLLAVGVALGLLLILGAATTMAEAVPAPGIGGWLAVRRVTRGSAAARRACDRFTYCVLPVRIGAGRRPRRATQNRHGREQRHQEQRARAPERASSKSRR
jgi:hypothetical protein